MPAGGMRYCDLVTLVHNQALPDFESELFPAWGDDPAAQLAGWRRERSGLYWGSSEISAFVDAMEQRGQRCTVRIWREFRPRGAPRRLALLSTHPEPPYWGEHPSLTLDLRHKGAADSPQAHYALLRSGHL